MVGVGPGVEVLHENLAPPDMGQHVGLEAGIGIGRHRGGVVPPDRGFGGRGPHDELVPGRPSGERAGGAEERPAPAQMPLTPGNGRLKQRGLRKVVMDDCHALNALPFQRVVGVCTALWHPSAPIVAGAAAGVCSRHKGA